MEFRSLESSMKVIKLLRSFSYENYSSNQGSRQHRSSEARLNLAISAKLNAFSASAEHSFLPMSRCLRPYICFGPHLSYLKVMATRGIKIGCFSGVDPPSDDDWYRGLSSKRTRFNGTCSDHFLLTNPAHRTIALPQASKHCEDTVLRVGGDSHQVWR